MDRLGATENRIEFVEAVGGTITFENLEIATPKGCTTLNERHSEHRVFIGGRSSCLPPQRTVLRDKEKLRTPQLPRQEYGGSAWGFAQAFYGAGNRAEYQQFFAVISCEAIPVKPETSTAPLVPGA
jgi:hypothetical protein